MQEKKRKVFQNQYVIARDFKNTSPLRHRCAPQTDVGSIEECIWFTAGEMGDGSIISKFPGIARDIDYLISHFFQKLQKGPCDKELLTELSEKL